ncbi:MAG TPA: zinc ribbon domain-containing protein [Candidatus Lokiarchaeia archaeon]|nr:zinc ribbon domain-containing protein [Candidatus Lokiarchaeia archaeon]
MYCEYCGTELTPGQDYCSNCGNHVATPERVTNTQGTEQSGAPRPTSLSRAPSPLFYIRYGPISSEDLQIFTQDGASFAKIEKTIGPTGFQVEVRDAAGQLALCLRQVQPTKFELMQAGEVIATMEEHIVLRQLKLVPKIAGEAIVTELTNFARQKSFHVRSQGYLTAAKLRVSKAEDLPAGLNPDSCFTLQVKNDAVDFLHLLGIVFLILFRYR